MYHLYDFIHFQDDMMIASDFFDYFSAMSFLLYEDPSVYAISAYNDNGQADFVMDPSRCVSPLPPSNCSAERFVHRRSVDDHDC